MKKMTTSRVGIRLIKDFEGLRLAAYKPVSTEKYYTIGWGHCSPDIKPNQVITHEQADDYLIEDISPLERHLNKLGINFRQEQFDALVSWLFNLGIGNFKKSNLLKRIQADATDEAIAAEFIKWIYSGNTPLAGLKKRRVAEANMFVGYELYYIDKNNNIKKK